MDNSADRINISFNNNFYKEIVSAIFIDEKRITMCGDGTCFIHDLRTQEDTYIFSKPTGEDAVFYPSYSGLCISQDRTLLGFKSDLSPYIYDICNKTLQEPFKRYSLRSQTFLDFNFKNDLIIYNDGYYTCFNNKGFADVAQISYFEPSLDIYLPEFHKGISCHPKENTFLFCVANALYSIDINTNELKVINTACSCKKAQYSPNGEWVFIRSNHNYIFVIKSSELVEEEYLHPQRIGHYNHFYKDARFHPTDSIMLLLTKQGVLEYWDYSKNKLIASQTISNEKIIGHSLCISPEGSRILVVSKGKLSLLDAPLSIRRPYKTILTYLILCNFIDTNSLPKDILREIFIKYAR